MGAKSLCVLLYYPLFRLCVPVKLSIPRLHIDANIEVVGLTTTGNIGAPEGPDGVGWFNKSKLPGEIGVSVIDGHSGYLRGTPAVFDKLFALRAGDTISITDSTSHTYVFIVRMLKNYAPDDRKTAEILNSYDGKSHLNLITYSSAWNESVKKHATRLVVFTDRI